MISNLPSEVCKCIVYYSSRQEIPSLSLTSRALQAAADIRLFEQIVLHHSAHAERTCNLISSSPRIGPRVRIFVLNTTRTHNQHVQLAPRMILALAMQTWESRQYWATVQSALRNMPILEYCRIEDPMLRNSWILNSGLPSTFKFRLQDAHLALSWDADMVSFLESQDQLQNLFVAAVPEEGRAPLPPDVLPSLRCFEGPLILVDQFYHCPITHLKIPINNDESVSLLPLVLPDFWRFNYLTSLCLVDLPDDLAVDCMTWLSLACPQIYYLSYIPLPIDNKPRIRLLSTLMRFKQLTYLELDLSHWRPRPSLPAHQRAFAIECRIYCPSLRMICFWLSRERWQWVWRVPSPINPNNRLDQIDLQNWRMEWAEMQNMLTLPTWRNV